MAPADAWGLHRPDARNDRWFSPAPGGLQQVLKAGGVFGIVSLGLSGAVLAILLLRGKLRFACPTCKCKETRMLWSSSGRSADLMCEHCGIFRETGFLNLKLHLEPYTDEHGNPLQPGNREAHAQYK
jgi:hypothetical protein